MPDRRVRLAATRRFPVPVERGFAFITDPDNWPAYWPGFVRLQPGSRWRAPGDEARLVVRLLGRERELVMQLVELAPDRLVRYTSSQAGLPHAEHTREFTPDAEGFMYGLAVAYQPRGGLAGVFDRTLLARSIRRAFAETLDALDREFATAPRRTS